MDSSNISDHPSKLDFSKHITSVQNRLIPKESMHFFHNQTSSRLTLTITDDCSVWKKDLGIGERLFSDVVVCPYQDTAQTFSPEIERVKEILKQRTKYPGVKDDPELMAIAKTWIVPSKLSLGPDASQFLSPSQTSIQDALAPVFERMQTSTIHYLKIEVANGAERQLVYKILDCGFRPGLLLIKWSYDVDEHIATAYCAGHLMNSGYSLVGLNDTYALYYYSEQVLYDLCSVKTIGYQNPFMKAIGELFQQHQPTTTMTPQPDSHVESNPSPTES